MSQSCRESNESFLSYFKGMDINELPSLIYQLILLGNKGPTESKATLLRGIANHLENLGKKFDEEYVRGSMVVCKVIRFHSFYF